MAGAYRDPSPALEGRRRELQLRVNQLDDDVPESKRRSLPPRLQRRLGELRDASEPSDDTLSSLVHAERAVEQYEHKLDEALGLAAELRRSVEPVLPRKEVVAKWSGLFALSMSLMVAFVNQMGLDDFMLRAFGVTSMRVSADIPVSRLAYEAQSPVRDAKAGAAAPAKRETVVLDAVSKKNTVVVHSRHDDERLTLHERPVGD